MFKTAPTDTEFLRACIVREERATRAILIYLLARELSISDDLAGRRVRKFLRAHRSDYRCAGGVLYAR